MTRFFSKFGFIHRRLWDRDGLYRTALLFGPAPLLGCVLAGALWAGFQAVMAPVEVPPSWAVVHPVSMQNSAAGEPRVVQPALPLPRVNADGSLTGYQPGWTVSARPIAVSATMNVDVSSTTLGNFNGFFQTGPNFDADRIIASGPKNTLFAGVASGYLVIREAGVYSLTARFDRSAANPANCLVRLAFGPGRVISNLELNSHGVASKTFDAVRFDLKPGLYAIFEAFGCWHEQEMTGPGRMTLLVGHPGEESPLPARADDIVR